ncbi:MAG: hypothetical protein AAF518_16430 [Spirochaetota bacterium]
MKDVFTKLKHGIFLGIGFSFGLLVSYTFAVTVSTLNTFTSGNTVSSSQINTNFSNLKTAIESVPDWIISGNDTYYSKGNVMVGRTDTPSSSPKLAVNGNISSSILGTYCGKSATTYKGGEVGGYTGAKSICETTCGDTNAHMCVGYEIIMSLQQGINVDSSVWVSEFHRNDKTETPPIHDCRGWTLSVSNEGGFVHTAPPGYTATEYETCDNSYSIACCL